MDQLEGKVGLWVGWSVWEVDAPVLRAGELPTKVLYFVLR